MATSGLIVMWPLFNMDYTQISFDNSNILTLEKKQEDKE